MVGERGRDRERGREGGRKGSYMYISCPHHITPYGAGSLLLESKVQPDCAYQKQETLIVWTEDEAMDLALSFQEKATCDDLWTKICDVSNAIRVPASSYQ